MKAFTPKDVLANMDKKLPAFVIDAVNSLLVKYFNGKDADVPQKDLIAKIKFNYRVEYGEDMSSSDVIFDNKWLDIEPVYEEAGWIVFYDKPAYTETYDPVFHFKKR